MFKVFPCSAFQRITFPRGIAKVDLEDILSPRRHRDRCGSARLQSGCPPRAQRHRDADRPDGSGRRRSSEVLKFDMAFHEAIIWASGNRPLITAFEAIREYHRYFQVFTSRWADDEHAAVNAIAALRALRSGQREGGGSAVRRQVSTPWAWSKQEERANCIRLPKVRRTCGG